MAQTRREANDNMLNKLEILFLVAIFSFTLLTSLSFASITCNPCQTNNCLCGIDECSSGLMRIYSSYTCRNPSYEYAFSVYQFTWTNAPAGNYYFKAFCSDGKMTSCTPITVNSAATVTTTPTSTTTKAACIYDCCSGEANYEDQPCPSGEECVNNSCQPVVQKKNYTWIIVLVLVLIVAVILFFFIFGRKPRKSFEELYRKWGK